MQKAFRDIVERLEKQAEQYNRRARELVEKAQKQEYTTKARLVPMNTQSKSSTK